MAQATGGIRRILGFPLIYKLLQSLLGSPGVHRQFVETFVEPAPGALILDIGCGPAEILEHLPEDVEYVGYDVNPKYIEYAGEKYEGRGEFLCARVSEASAHPRAGEFDVVLALAVLHHLDDGEASDLFESAHHHLKPGGRLVTIDSAYVPDQPRIAKFLIDRDRGRHTRTPEAYVALAEKHFASVETSVRHDMLTIPYTLIMMRCTK
jgi:SAM-dependent methyltransferase